MKKVRMLMILLIFILPLPACIQEILLFTGESDYWSIRYEVNKSEVCGKSSGAIKYIGNEPVPESIKFSIDNLEGDVSLEPEGVFSLPFGCSNVSKESEIEAIIEWDGKTETIALELN
ncbi:hypothetical protein [Ureibacillus sp. FSL W8-0352]|uniref:hypothetical protein n=1 Tax=Ureibacillus sp. FSL W8-0352 TaxID=2954596 RepID=UPI0030F894A5